MSAQKLRVLIVDDSVLYRKILRESISQIGDIDIVGTCIDGVDAVEAARRLKPDLITLDQEMPRMTGIEALKTLRQDLPATAILMVSSLTLPGAQVTTEALQLGAFDFILKPKDGTFEKNVQELAGQLREKIETFRASRGNSGVCSVVDSPRAAKVIKPSTTIDRDTGLRTLTRNVKCGSRIEAVLIGISTGGPAALAKVIPALPEDLPVPIIIVQHMPPMFTRSLADHLNGQSKLAVCEGRDLQLVLPGTVYIAPGGKQMKINGNAGQTVLRVTDDAAENAARPSVDYLFRSASDVYGPRCLAVVMTGMGSDGLAGCRILKEKGATVFAQDQATSTVYGMPRAVAENGLAHEVLPLGDIAPAITQAVMRSLTACT